MKDHEHYMSIALQLARECVAEDEVPIGCIIVDAGGVVIGRGRNRRERNLSALAHAEINATKEA